MVVCLYTFSLPTYLIKVPYFSFSWNIFRRYLPNSMEKIMLLFTLIICLLNNSSEQIYWISVYFTCGSAWPRCKYLSPQEWLFKQKQKISVGPFSIRFPFFSVSFFESEKFCAFALIFNVGGESELVLLLRSLFDALLCLFLRAGVLKFT